MRGENLILGSSGNWSRCIALLEEACHQAVDRGDVPGVSGDLGFDGKNQVFTFGRAQFIEGLDVLDKGSVVEFPNLCHAPYFVGAVGLLQNRMPESG